jgi:alkylation response protein AidB-like acyl-CoA dehydrogenase
MSLILNDEQQLLRDSARAFFRETSPVESYRRLRDSGEEWSPDLWSAMSELGWPGVVVPEAYEGLEFGYLGAGLLCEEAGRTLVASPLVSSAVVAATVIGAFGTESQRRELLPQIARGELICTTALEEAADFDPQALSTTVATDGSGLVIRGAKSAIVDGALAHKWLVVGRSDTNAAGRDGLRVVVVDRGVPGVHVEEYRRVDNRRVLNLRFDAAHVDRGALLSGDDDGPESLEKALDAGAACIAAELLGMASEAFDRTLGYLKERNQFGVPIGSFQALQHRAAMLYCELELCRSIVLKALKAIDANDPERPLLVSMAKAKADRTAQLSVNEAIQMHGGIGMTDEFDIGFFVKRAAAARREYGDYYYHAERVARLRGY